MGTANGWREVLRGRLPLYGHRNWIVVADAAYPAQASPGVETLVVAEDQLEVLQEVLASVAASGYVRPIVYVDRELAFVNEGDARGIDAYRERLAGLTQSCERQDLLHEEIISRLDLAGRTFRILVIKTTMRIPYTSVFLRLDCAYWSAEAEQRLRRVMTSKDSATGHPME